MQVANYEGSLRTQRPKVTLDNGRVIEALYGTTEYERFIRIAGDATVPILIAPFKKSNDLSIKDARADELAITLEGEILDIGAGTEFKLTSFQGYDQRTKEPVMVLLTGTEVIEITAA